MKIQDLGFVIVFLFLLWRRDFRLGVMAGMICLLLAMSLFKYQIFFTAERLTWYAAALFALSVLLQLRLKTPPRWPPVCQRLRRQVMAGKNGLLGGGENKDRRRGR